MDAVDQALLRALRVDGRSTHRALARACGLPEAQVRARLERLLGPEGVRVVGYVHPLAAGLGGTIHLSITVRGNARPVARRLVERPDTQFVSLTAGHQAIVAEVRVPTYDHIAAIVTPIRAIRGVEEVLTLTHLTPFRDMYAPTGPLGPHELDDVDWRLIELLQADGRASYTALADAIGVSIGTARNRVIRLISDGILHVGAETRPDLAAVRDVTVGVGVVFSDDGAEVIEHLSADPTVTYAATTVGRFDAVATLATHEYNDMLDALERLRGFKSVKRLDAWSHLSVVKQSYALTRDSLERIDAR